MKFTNAILASILFFGVTPLALDKKRDEHAVTASFSPFATVSPVSFATPDDAGIVDITYGTHDVLEARARGSRASGRRVTSSRVKKTKTNTRKRPKTHKTKPRTKCTAAQKKAGKCKGTSTSTCTAAQKKANGGKCPSTCTAAQKKANGGTCPITCTAAQKKANGGTCPNTCTAAQKKANGGKCPPKKKRYLNVVFPTKGCRGKNCKNCKATGGKGGKKGGKKSIRDLFSPRSLTLAKRAATFEPALKTEAGLNAWTKDVFASDPKELPIASDGQKPTSFFVKWSSLGEGINFVTIKSLMGCTAIVAVSDEGVYASHHWQHTVGDNSLADVPAQYANAFTNPLTGQRRASFDLSAAQKQECKDFSIPESTFKDSVNSIFPTSGFEPLTDVKSSLATNVQSMVAVWDNRVGNGDTYRTTGPKMRTFVDGILAGPATKLVQYENTESAVITSNDNNDYHGKVIISYDSAAKKYQVWMPAAQLSGPVLEN